MEVVRTDKEIEKVLDKAIDGVAKGSKYPGMSFEEGVREMYDWLTGDQDEPPLEDE